MTVTAIGDVHGCYSLLCDVVDSYRDSGNELIFLGDLVDRSPEPNGDANVVRLVRHLQEHPEDYGLSGVTVLKGNHEELLCKSIERGPKSRAYEIWEYNGGDPTALDDLKEHYEWLDNLPTHTIRGDHLFVHAGVRPGVPLEEQTDFDMQWIRGSFLTEEHGLPYVVIHGHTIHEGGPDIHDHRIGIDTGAYFTGELTALDIAID